MSKRIQLENVTKKFGGKFLAVDDVSIEIPEGSFTTIVGPSGCGKTTTLRMISGLETPSSGRILFDDEDMTETLPQDRNIAMVFQNIALYPHMSVRKNIGYGLKVKGVPKEERNERIEEAAEFLHISDQLDKMPAELSGGQQQRVALGAAFVEDPDVILLDEPMSDLDAKLKAELRVETQRVHEEMDTTMVYVTHDQTEALTMSDHIMLMQEGEIAQFGPPEELFSDPDSEYVATFIGTPSTNVLEYEATQIDGELMFVGHGHQIPANGYADSLSGAETVQIGIRPQYVSIGGGDFTTTITVDVVELLGTEHVVYGETEDGEELDVVTQSSPNISAGDELTVGFDEEDILVFDSDGRSINKKNPIESGSGIES